MVALQGFGWPHDESTTRSKTLQSAPTSPIVKPSSIGRLIRKVQGIGEIRHSSEANCPQLPAFRTLSPLCTNLQTKSPKPVSHTGIDPTVGLLKEPFMNDRLPEGLDGAGLGEDTICPPFSASYDILGLYQSDVDEDAMPPLDLNSEPGSINSSAIEDLQILSSHSDAPMNPPSSQSCSKYIENESAIEPSKTPPSQSDIPSEINSASTSKRSAIGPAMEDHQTELSEFETQSEVNSLDLSAISIPWDVVDHYQQVSVNISSGEASEGAADLSLQSSSKDTALGPAIEDLQTLMPQIDTPAIVSLELSGDGTRGSFNALVLDLLQGEPDFPIGGIKAAPMAPKPFSNSKTITTQSKKSPYLKGSCTKLPNACKVPKFSGLDAKITRRVSSHSNSSGGLVGTENRPMVTAPETPLDQRSEEEDNKQQHSDGSRKTNFNSQDSARNDSSWRTSFPVIPRGVTEPTSQKPKFYVGKEFARPGSPAPSQGDAAGDPLTDAAPAPIAPRVPTKKPPGIDPSKPEVPEVPNTAGLPEVDAMPEVPLDIPTDVTGELPVPEIPGGQPKNKTSKMIVRKARAAIFSETTLKLLIGRQLAGPTATALELIAKGSQIDPIQVTGVVNVPGDPIVPV